MSNELFELLPAIKGAPLGATLDSEGCNFAVCSPEATEVYLCLFDHSEHEIKRIKLEERVGQYWCGYVKGVRAGQLYGYCVNGENNPVSGNQFDVTKLLIDPYARQLNKPQEWNYERYLHDNSRFVSKSVVIDGKFDWEGVEKPNLTYSNAIIYETHVRGYTKLRMDIPPELRGTYLGMCQPQVIEHLKKLGITAIQFLPVHAHMDESRLIDLKLCNYWGYNTINFFSPEPKYASDPANAVNEFKTMVKTLHQNGIGVILDVVYNHTAEGGHGGPSISFRGFDNKHFYIYEKNSQGHKVYTSSTNCTGCGNSVNADNLDVLRLILDSLRYWATEMQIDGFRFDLATTLAREEAANGYTPNAAFFKAMAIDPIISKCLLIAEPWDVGGYGYRVGQFPNNWSELNDHYRDTIRSFWKGDEGRMAEFATRILGSRDIYPKTLRSIHSSVNFISYHDGFTLHDVVSYNFRHNEANCEDNRDGNSTNLSYNYGEEGPTANVRINNIREQQKRNMLTTLLLSQGIPHILAGDEMGRSQMGNNNAYCQDNRISWVNWDLSDDDKDLVKFVSKLIKIRKGSSVFKQLNLPDDKFFGKVLPSHKVSWYHSDGHTLTACDWNNPQSRLFTLDIGEVSGRGERYLVLFNASSYDIGFHLPDPGYGMEWQPILDSSEPDGEPFPINSRSQTLIGLTKAHSVKIIMQVENNNPEVRKQFRHRPGSKVRIGINGFGRIGRTVLRTALLRDDLEVVGVNDPLAGVNGEVTPEGISYLAYLLEHDSTHGSLDARVEINGRSLVINGRAIRVTARENPEDINWAEVGVEVVVESSGRFASTEKSQGHIRAGAVKVVISANTEDDTPTYVMGVNEQDYDGADIISNASCTTNCLAPLVKVLYNKFGIESGLMTTVHAYTSSQLPVDGPTRKGWRDGRAAGQNIIPTTTGAADAVEKVIPDLKGLFTGVSFRVPVADVSVVDLTVNLRYDTTYEEVCKALQEASEGELKGILGYISEPVVSSDILGGTCTSYFDSSAGVGIGKRMFKLLSWYDNESGYSSKLLDLASFIMNQ